MEDLTEEREKYLRRVRERLENAVRQEKEEKLRRRRQIYEDRRRKKLESKIQKDCSSSESEKGESGRSGNSPRAAPMKPEEVVSETRKRKHSLSSEERKEDEVDTDALEEQLLREL